MLRPTVVATALSLGVVANVCAQTPPFAFADPPPGTVALLKDVVYAGTGADAARMDVYRGTALRDSAPVVIFFNVAAGDERRWPFYTAWARHAASKGLVAVVPDLRRQTLAQDFDALLAFLRRPLPELGVDPEAIAVYAGSGNVSSALPLVEDPRRTAVKAAVIYYGSADIAAWRRDLPVLYVRAGLDRPPVNAEIARLAASAVADNAPVTFLNHGTGHHGFEARDSGRCLARRDRPTLDFVRSTTAPGYQEALRRGLAEATAASHVMAGRFRDAAAAYADLVSKRPDDPTLALAYGEALSGAGEYTRACTLFDGLRDKALGPRDRGLPAARACVQAGRPDEAIAWLRTIPRRFLPSDVEHEPVFAPLAGRTEFHALFAPDQTEAARPPRR